MLNQGQVSGKTPKDAKSDALFHAIQELEVPPGAAWIRLAVRDQLNNRTGTLEIHMPLKPETTTAALAEKPNPAEESPASTSPARSGPTTN
jgi:hypothetical protein